MSHSIRFALAAAALATAFTSPCMAQTKQTVCAFETGDKLSIKVSFNGQWEQGLIVSDDRTKQRVRLFNSYFGNGAGNEWHQGAGTWTYTFTNSLCVQLQALHKASGPNAKGAWLDSRVKMIGNGRLGYEDSTDGDFNDIRVKLSVISTDGTVSVPEIQ